MKKSLGIFLLAGFLAWQPAISQELNLSGFWKFIRGDSTVWAQADYDDSKWAQIPVGAGWEEFNENFDGFAWYRLRVIIPSNLKKESAAGLELYIKQINDADQTFLNGTLIGTTDNPYQPDLLPSNVQRHYLLPFDRILWDKENVIAIRVYNIKNYGGLFSGPVLLRPLPSQYFRNESKEIEFALEIPSFIEMNSKNSMPFTVFNKSETKLEGHITLTVCEDIFREAENDSIWLSIPPGSSRKGDLKLPASQGGLHRIFAVLHKSDGTEVSYNLGAYLVNDKNKTQSGLNYQSYINGSIKPVRPDLVHSFFEAPDFGQQKFEGYLNWRMNVNTEKRLLDTDTAFLLRKFRGRGYLSDGKPYDGEHIGKFFHAGCNSWLLTKNPALKAMMDDVFKKWIQTQLPDGYLGTYLPDEYWDDWDVWVHKYDLIGLLSYYKAFNNIQALESSIKIGNLLVKTFGDDPGKLKIEKIGRHVGLASMSVLDPMVELYRYTGDSTYLKFCWYIVKSYENESGPKLFSSLYETHSVKKTANAKAYEMLSNFSGLVKLYMVTGDKKLLEPVFIAWNDIVTHRLFITGSTSQDEKFQDDDHYEISPEFEPSEGCVTTTWLQLNILLYYATGNPVYIGMYENTYYNQLLAAQSVKTGCVCYFTPVQEAKYPSCGVTCCLSSITRGITTLPEIAWGKYKNGLGINLYTGGSFSTSLQIGKKEIPVSVECYSDFPKTGKLTYKMLLQSDCTFPIYFRVPAWCEKFTATINGKSYSGLKGTYLEISRTWKNNEVITISFDMSVLKISGTNFSYPGSICIQRGPQILAIDKAYSKYSPFQLIDWSNPQLNIEFVENKGDTCMGEYVYKSGWTFKGTSEPVFFVPFAEAGQNNKPFAVWLSNTK